jgi:S-adenosylmethionine synthetase
MMRARNFLFTSESVTEGHPDKIADQISDGILDAIMSEDPEGRVACETLVTSGLAFVAGEITTDTYIDIPKIVRETIKDVGYIRPEYGFHWKTCAVITAIQEQSKDIARGVDIGGAGDQGVMYGYATNETPEYMPLPIMLAHKLVRRLAEVRKKKILKYLRPDGKSQVTIEYKNGKPVKVKEIVVSAQHNPGVKINKMKEDIIHWVIKYIVPKKFIDKHTKILVNPTGRFVIGGPQGDTGVTGRKIIVDTYGGVGSHGGGCYSGKDPTKVDRSASYMARYIVKNIVASGIAKKCEIQLAYAIGVVDPVSIMLNTFGTSIISDEKLVKVIPKIFDLTPRGMIRELKLRRPIFRKTACYGHFGREEDGFTWEYLDKVEDLRRAFKI